MTQLQTHAEHLSGTDVAPPIVDIAIPVYNERHDLEMAVRRLRLFLDHDFPLPCVITIVDNGSHDGTWEIAQQLSAELLGVRALHLDRKGRGRALKTAWSRSDAHVVAYMDADMSTELEALLPLVAPLLSGHSDIAIGSRLAPGARTVRGAKREAISRTYNFLLRAILGCRFSDAQCGFKALRAEDARALLPAIADNEWFFDTEMLVLAEHNGLRIHEVPVDWSDDPDSRVHLGRTALADLRGMARMYIARATRSPRNAELGARRADRSAVSRRLPGLPSLFFYLALFLVTRKVLGPWQANLVSLTATAVLNAALHFSSSFANPRSRRSLAALGLIGSFCTSMAATTLSLVVAESLFPSSSAADLVALVAGSAAAAVTWFLVEHDLEFRNRAHAAQAPPGASSTT